MLPTAPKWGPAIFFRGVVDRATHEIQKILVGIQLRRIAAGQCLPSTLVKTSV